MCGIVGSIGVLQIDESAVLSCIGHRGPDSNGMFREGNVFLGHTRLSIQDLSENGRQPMSSPDGRYTIIFNGEIYNHLDVRKGLTAKYHFTSSSDTQTLLYGFIEYGPTLLNKLNGIFALAIYDNVLRRIFIARDQLGVKPLYYYFKDGILLFGSEIKSFLPLFQFDRSINYNSLVNYISLLWSPGKMTPFSEVNKLLPGHYIQYNLNDEKSFSTQKFYEVPFVGKYLSENEDVLVEELDKRLMQAVERQLLSDVPVAFFLSGGLDSSAIVAMAKKLRPNERLRCYTIKTTQDAQEEGFADDLTYARLVAERLDLDLVEVEAEVDIVGDFDKMIYHLDEPQADAAPLNVLKICQQARLDGYTVLLGGTAGDDLFSGYRRHQALRYDTYIEKTPWVLRRMLTYVVSWLPASRPIFRRLRKFTANLELSKQDRLFSYFEWLKVKTTKKLFNEELYKNVALYEPKDYFFELLKNIPEERSDLNHMLYWEQRTFLVDHNLNYTDKLSMAVGVEVRVPFLDIELLEFSTLIPPALKIKGTETKYLLKKLMENYLPKEVIYRPKTGFGAPVRKWIIQDLDEKLNTYLSEQSIRKRGIFDPEKVAKLISDTKSGKIDGTYSIWSLLAIESWFRQFIDKRQ